MAPNSHSSCSRGRGNDGARGGGDPGRVHCRFRTILRHLAGGYCCSDGIGQRLRRFTDDIGKRGQLSLKAPVAGKLRLTRETGSNVTVESS